MKKFGGDVIKQAEAALAKLQSENKKLTESNLLDVLRSLHSEASGQEGLAVATERATQLTLDAYRTGKCNYECSGETPERGEYFLCTASYGPSFSLPFMAQARSARAMKTGKEKTRIHNLPYGPSKRG